MLAVLAHGFAAFAANVGHMLAVLADALAAFLADGGHVLAVLADPLATALADGCHVLAVSADGCSAFGGDLPLLLVVHCGKSAGAAARAAGAILGVGLVRPLLALIVTLLCL